MIVLDASAAIDAARSAPNAGAIEDDLSRERPVQVPAHFEADAYAGLRRMVNTRALDRESLATILTRLTTLPAERVPLAPLLPRACSLFDSVGAHDSFYAALALAQGAALVTSDGRLARTAAQLGVRVRYRPAADGDGAA